MEDQHPKWSFQEFSAFTLLYAAGADLHIDPKEIEFIKERCEEEAFERVVKEYKEASDYQKIQIILKYRHLYFSTPERRDELVELIKKEFFADGNYSLLERNLMLMLDKLM